MRTLRKREQAIFHCFQHESVNSLLHAEQYLACMFTGASCTDQQRFFYYAQTMFQIIYTQHF